MAASNIIKHSDDGGSIVLSDGTGTPLTLTIRWDSADFAVTSLVPDLREVVVYDLRGQIVNIRKGKPAIPSLSFSAMVSDLSESTGGTILDWLAKRAPFASRVSTSTAIGDVDTCTVTVTFEGTTYGDGADQTIACEKVALSCDFATGGPNKFSISGTVYGDVKVNGSAAFTRS